MLSLVAPPACFLPPILPLTLLRPPPIVLLFPPVPSFILSILPLFWLRMLWNCCMCTFFVLMPLLIPALTLLTFPPNILLLTCAFCLFVLLTPIFSLKVLGLLLAATALLPLPLATPPILLDLYAAPISFFPRVKNVGAPIVLAFPFEALLPLPLLLRCCCCCCPPPPFLVTLTAYAVVLASPGFPAVFFLLNASFILESFYIHTCKPYACVNKGHKRV